VVCQGSTATETTYVAGSTPDDGLSEAILMSANTSEYFARRLRELSKAPGASAAQGADDLWPIQTWITSNQQ
jgi:hypothetical protein